MANRFGSAAAAAYVGVAHSTWRAYVARQQAPQADGVDENFGVAYWKKSTLDKWKESRPGKGGRPPKTRSE